MNVELEIWSWEAFLRFLKQWLQFVGEKERMGEGGIRNTNRIVEINKLVTLPTCRQVKEREGGRKK